MHEFFSDRLYTPAIDSVAVTMRWEGRPGFHLAIYHRHSGEDWSACPIEQWDALTASELIDVVTASLELLLNWPST
jgi:hypothetical protein